MRILIIREKSEYIQHHIAIHFTQVDYRIMIFISHQFSPYGRAGGFHALRAAAYSAYVIKDSQ